MSKITTRRIALGLIAAAAGYGLAVWREPEPAILAPGAGTAESITFFAVGRQGYDPDVTGPIADGMERLAAETPPHFLVFAGDNFFPDGVASEDDPLWQTRFEDLYDGPHLRGTPSYAVLGNHDLRGDREAEIEYAHERLGSARWRMGGRWYARDFGRVEQEGDLRVLVRIVFLDMIPMQKDPESAAAQTAFLREAMAAPGDPVWKVVVGHNPLRSLTEQRIARSRIMDALREECAALGVDLAISANDWFQQLLDVPGEAMSVSTSGGGRSLEEVPTRMEPRTYTRSQRGFSRVTLDARRMVVDMLDESGEPTFRATRER